MTSSLLAGLKASDLDIVLALKIAIIYPVTKVLTQSQWSRCLVQFTAACAPWQSDRTMVLGHFNYDQLGTDEQSPGQNQFGYADPLFHDRFAPYSTAGFFQVQAASSVWH
jgi:hypothetical protein